jgi:hypothetical protein
MFKMDTTNMPMKYGSGQAIGMNLTFANNTRMFNKHSAAVQKISTKRM